MSRSVRRSPLSEAHAPGGSFGRTLYPELLHIAYILPVRSPPVFLRWLPNTGLTSSVFTCFKYCMKLICFSCPCVINHVLFLHRCLMDYFCFALKNSNFTELFLGVGYLDNLFTYVMSSFNVWLHFLNFRKVFLKWNFWYVSFSFVYFSFFEDSIRILSLLCLFLTSVTFSRIFFFPFYHFFSSLFLQLYLHSIKFTYCEYTVCFSAFLFLPRHYFHVSLPLCFFLFSLHC